MNAAVNHEQCFMALLDSLEVGGQEAAAQVLALRNWRAQLEPALRGGGLDAEGLEAQTGLARQAQAINLVLHDALPQSLRQWCALDQTRALSQTLDQHVLLLVFGKFNAGKSALCNFLARRFAAQGRPVQYFHVARGRIVETPASLEEGGTETTSRLQGVRLGDRLVLLDTPGLHSMTAENAELTRRFTESADGVLWLTNSTSPGQVQELDELARELHRNKPLLPVITRSDFYDEDEVGGEIRRVLCNKTEENRAQQETDVAARAKDKLSAMGVDPALLAPPVSVSVYMAREQRQTHEAMARAGFERLYAALAAMAQPALAYKQRKPAEVMLHYLEERVLGVVGGKLAALLAELQDAARTALRQLERRQDQLVKAVWRSVMPTLPATLEKHAASRDAHAVGHAVSQSIVDAFSIETAALRADYRIVLKPELARITLADDAGYDYLARDADGAGNLVAYARLYSVLEQSIEESLLRCAADIARQCRHAIQTLDEQAAHLGDALQARKAALLALKRELRG